MEIIIQYTQLRLLFHNVTLWNHCNMAHFLISFIHRVYSIFSLSYNINTNISCYGLKLNTINVHLVVCHFDCLLLFAWFFFIFCAFMMRTAWTDWILLKLAAKFISTNHLNKKTPIKKLYQKIYLLFWYRSFYSRIVADFYGFGYYFGSLWPQYHKRTSKKNYYQIWENKNDNDLLKTCRNIFKMVPVFRIL